MLYLIGCGAENRDNYSLTMQSGFTLLPIFKKARKFAILSGFNRNLFIIGGKSDKGYPRKEVFLLKLEKPNCFINRSEMLIPASSTTATISAKDKAIWIAGGSAQNKEILSKIQVYDIGKDFWSILSLSLPCALADIGI